MMLFLLIFFLLYGGLHFYLFQKARAALAFSTWPGVFLMIFMLIMIGAPVIVRVSAGYGFEFLTRLMAFLGYVWMGFVVLLFFYSLVIDLYRFLLFGGGLLAKRNFFSVTPSASFAFFLPLILSLAQVTYGYFEAKDVHIERIAMRTSKIPPQAGRISIVQISDVHLGLIIREERLSRILRAVKEAEPDMLVSTGDLLDGQINNLAGFAELLRQVKPRYGKFAITGNHEFYAGLSEALRVTEAAGFTLLRGEGVTIAGLINVAGVDDRQGKSYGLMREVSENWLLSRLPREKFTLLLKHRPEVEKSSLGLFDLQLSGHTHKGQFFPFNIVTHFIYQADSGLARLPNNSYLYVSRGAGTWGPPIRFLSPPEVTVIELVHEDNIIAD